MEDLQAVADDDALLDRIGAGDQVLAPDELAILLIEWRTEITEDSCLSHDAVTSILQKHSSLLTSPPVSFRSMTRKFYGRLAEIWRRSLDGLRKQSQRNPRRD